MPTHLKEQITCPSCLESITITQNKRPNFCPFCGNLLANKNHSSLENLSNRYQLIDKIGKGGMGEVFLAYDAVCGRKIALKRIRSDLINHPQIKHRFLKEAHITCQLTHPAIIPIYSIQTKENETFYTMPFVEGETLKQIIRKGRKQEKKGEKPDLLVGSIPALMRIFLSVCQAVAYAHAKGIIHRDLKLENIIVGKYGEVLILDWGLAKSIYTDLNETDHLSNILIETPSNNEITRIGKVVGTVTYMAPERALGNPATKQTDIYSLGVILYQLLTLKNPFNRGCLEEFKRSMKKEELVDPVLVAPYRDIPRGISHIVSKALSVDLNERYQSVDSIIYELENYLSGRSEWFLIASIDQKQKEDWEFQENILIAEHTAITPATVDSEWVNLMISGQSFTGNIRIETTVVLGNKGYGIGILISIPETSERTFINDGYCLWLASDLHQTTKLLRSNVEVMQAPEIYLRRHHPTKVRIEKIDRTIYLYLDDALQFSYTAQIPLMGTHVGLLFRDGDFSLEPLKVSVGSLSLNVNCLAVPDAFLVHRDFTQALSEYRRIAYSFPDRAEGREALFRAGITFIEQAKESKEKMFFLEQALQEFEKLHKTPAGPLEYLGKALVYQTLNDFSEEIKCFELAFRRYPKHPLLYVLQEQILSRLNEISRKQRIHSYQFILLIVRHFNLSMIDTHTKRLLNNLQKHWEPLSFIQEPENNEQDHYVNIAISLAFWLNQPYILGEIIDDSLFDKSIPAIDLENAFVCLFELGAWKYAKEKLIEVHLHPRLKEIAIQEIHKMLMCHEMSLDHAFSKIFQFTDKQLNYSEIRTCFYAIEQAFNQEKLHLVQSALDQLQSLHLTNEIQMQIDIFKIKTLLMKKDWIQAQSILNTYSSDLLNKSTTLLHFLYGCCLQAVDGNEAAMMHFMNLIPMPFPRSWTLGGYDLIGELTQQGWIENAFDWEKRNLYRQLALFSHCSGDEKTYKYYKQLSILKDYDKLNEEESLN
ncbi:MAG: serine/threonine-protein kinase PknD [Parachlamydiaceae bacterium]|nr:serine/threonine-protein kinase PknD [Parachlamydiaceae bacterium]